MIYLNRLILAASAALFIVGSPAHAQWQVPDHSVPVGRGAGTGFKSVGPCLTGVPIVGAGASADPVCSAGGAWTGFANPSASIGLSAVNGSATTAMRSDAAPALSQSISPTWAGTHTFNILPVLPNQTANTVWAGPTNGVAATPAFRALVPGDIPTVANASGSPSATAGIMKCDGTTTTCSSGVVTAVGGIATDIAVGTTTVSSGSNGNILYNNSGVLGEHAIAAAADFEAGTAGKVLDAASVFTAEVTTTFNASQTLNFSTFLNTKITLTANITSMTCSNIKAGQSGTIRMIQSSAGSYTTVWCSEFKWAGGSAAALTTGSTTAVDALVYTCISSSYCVVSLIKNVS